MGGTQSNGERAVAVLLVDDDPQRRNGLAAALGAAGAAVCDVADPDTARQQTHLNPPRVVLCAALPQERGTQACRVLAGALPAGVPLLCYGGQVAEAVRLRFLELGADEFVETDTAAAAAMARLSGADTTAGADGGGGAVPAMYFALKAGEVSNVLQFLSFTARSGALLFAGPDGRGAGAVFFTAGQIVHAEAGEHTGVDALADLFLLPAADARFSDGLRSPGQTIQIATNHVLMEAAIRADELAAMRRGEPVEPEEGGP